MYANSVIDQLPDQYLSRGLQLLGQVSNPFYGSISSGPLSGPTVAASQLLLPYPQFTQVNLGNGSAFGASSYNALFLKVERQFSKGFGILGSYTWSKLMDNIPGTPTGFAGGATFQDFSGPQDYYNLKAERSLATFDLTQSVAINGVWEQPFGREHRLAHDNRLAE